MFKVFSSLYSDMSINRENINSMYGL